MARPRALADDMIRVPIYYLNLYYVVYETDKYLPVQITHIPTKIHT